MTNSAVPSVSADRVVLYVLWSYDIVPTMVLWWNLFWRVPFSMNEISSKPGSAFVGFIFKLARGKPFIVCAKSSYW